MKKQGLRKMWAESSSSSAREAAELPGRLRRGPDFGNIGECECGIIRLPENNADFIGVALIPGDAAIALGLFRGDRPSRLFPRLIRELGGNDRYEFERREIGWEDALKYVELCFE